MQVNLRAKLASTYIRSQNRLCKPANNSWANVSNLPEFSQKKLDTLSASK